MFIGSLNAPIIKHVTASLNPIMFNTVRFGLAAAITLPFFLMHLHKLSKRNARYSILSGVCLFISALCFAVAIDLSTATYVALLTLLHPVMLVIFSIKMTNDKVDAKRMTGFSLAALGALLVIAAPLISAGNADIRFYPLATMLVLVMIVTYPLAIIFTRKANESRVRLPIVSAIFIQTFTIFIFSLVAAIITNNLESPTAIASNKNTILAILYSGVLICIIDRVLNVKSYEHVGSAVNGGLAYMGIFISIIVAVVTLGETLSLTAVLGGIVILIGVIITDHKLPRKHRHNQHLLRHH